MNNKIDYEHHQKWLPLHLQKCKDNNKISYYPHNAMLLLEFDNLYKENQKLKKLIKAFLSVAEELNK